jgi:phosphoglucosamine mutase
VSASVAIQFDDESTIRGTAGEYPLDPSTLLRIGRGIGRWLMSQPHVETREAMTALFGQDTRITSPMLMQALATGLMAEGVTIVNAGIIPLPGVCHLLNASGSKFDIGLFVGAGSEPAPHNGFTLIGRDGFPLSSVEQAAVEQLIELLRDDRMARGGSFRRYSLLPAADLLDQYLSHLTDWCAPDALNGWRVVLDCANGAAHKIAPEALKLAGAELLMTVNDTNDGASINFKSGSAHTIAHSKALVEIVQTMDADAGIALSGSGDGVAMVTAGGTVLDGDVLLSILAVEMQSADNLPENTICVSSTDSSRLEKFLRRYDISLIRHAAIIQTMRQRGLRIGGFSDGRIVILDDTHTSADGLYVALLIGWLAAHYKRSDGPTLDQIAAQIMTL